MPEAKRVYPPTIARETPDLTAYLMAGSGEHLTFAELDARSNQLAHLLRDRGVRPGDSLVVFLPNHLAWPVAIAAGMRSGLLVTPVNWHIGFEELRPIMEEAAPAAVVTSRELAPVVRAALRGQQGDPLVLTADGAASDTEDFFATITPFPTEPIDGELLGARVLFSGGTTGRPTPYRQPLLGIHPLDAPPRHPGLAQKLGIEEGIRFYSPAPSYHAAPFTFQLMTLAVGGTVVCAERFDAQTALRDLVEHEITHSQWVPTMLGRLLAVEDRDHVPLSPTHRVAVTSGAPCPPERKDAINDWWGDVLHEYYGASEGYGHTYISPEESRGRSGSVGRPLGAARVRVIDLDGSDVPVGEVGRVCFEQAGVDGTGPTLKGMGDMGRLDADGYLYLTGRATFMIISGGVNIYPEEIENVLMGHPQIQDVAIFGVPHPDLGEQVMAVIELADGTRPSTATEELILTYANEHLARFKTPRQLVFVDQLPRMPTGKLNKAALRSTYVPSAGTQN